MHGLVGWPHVDDDDPGLLPRIHIAIGVRDGFKGKFPINDHAEFTRELDAHFRQELRSTQQGPVTIDGHRNPGERR